MQFENRFSNYANLGKICELRKVLSWQVIKLGGGVERVYEVLSLELGVELLK